MTKLTWLCTLLLAFGMSAFAQTSTGGSSQSGSMSGNDSGMTKHDNNMGKKTSMTGCISQQDGKYMLMNKKNANGVELMSSQDLSAHVGHKVKVDGMWEKGSMSSGVSNGSSSTSSNSGEKMDHNMVKSFQVNDVKMISDHCDMSMDKGSMKK